MRPRKIKQGSPVTFKFKGREHAGKVILMHRANARVRVVLGSIDSPRIEQHLIPVARLKYRKEWALVDGVKEAV